MSVRPPARNPRSVEQAAFDVVSVHRAFFGALQSNPNRRICLLIDDSEPHPNTPRHREP